MKRRYWCAGCGAELTGSGGTHRCPPDRPSSMWTCQHGYPFVGEHGWTGSNGLRYTCHRGEVTAWSRFLTSEIKHVGEAWYDNPITQVAMWVTVILAVMLTIMLIWA